MKSRGKFNCAKVNVEQWWGVYQNYGDVCLLVHVGCVLVRSRRSTDNNGKRREVTFSE